MNKKLRWLSTIISLLMISLGLFKGAVIAWEFVVIGGLFLIPWLITRFDNEYNMGEVVAKYLSLNDRKVSPFNSSEYKKLLGSSSKVIRENTYLFPLGYKFQASYSFKFTGMAAQIDHNALNNDRANRNDIISQNAALQKKYDEDYRRISAKNLPIQQQYDTLMGSYEMALQTYNLAQQTRAQTIQQTKSENRLLATVLTSGGKKPKKPTLSLYKLPKLKQLKVPQVPKESKYSKFTDAKKGLIDRNDVDLNFCTMDYSSKAKFNNDHNIQNDKVTFGLLVDSYLKAGKSVWGKKINEHALGDIEILMPSASIDTESNITETIFLSDKDLYIKKKIANLSNLSSIEEYFCKNILTDVKKSIGKEELPEIGQVTLKNIQVEITKFSYKLSTSKLLPLQFVEYADKKGKKTVKVLDFMSKYRIEVN